LQRKLLLSYKLPVVVIETARSSETSVELYQTTRRHIPEANKLRSGRYEGLKYHGYHELLNRDLTLPPNWQHSMWTYSHLTVWLILNSCVGAW